MAGLVRKCFLLAVMAWSMAMVPAAVAAESTLLEVDGLVAKPLALGRADLLALPHSPTGQGEAVSLRDILAQAKPLPTAARMIFLGPDGFASSLVLDLALFQDESLRLLIPGPDHDAAGFFLEASSRERLGYKWVDLPIRRMVLVDEALRSEQD